MWRRICVSLRTWQWQMGNYRSNIRVPCLRDKWPAISPADARDDATLQCEKPRLSTSGTSACAAVASISSSIWRPQQRCSSSPGECWPHAGHTEQDNQIPLGDERRGVGRPLAFIDMRTKQQNPLFLQFCVQHEVLIDRRCLRGSGGRDVPKTCWSPHPTAPCLFWQKKEKSFTF